MSLWGVQPKIDADIGDDNSSAEGSPEKIKKRRGKKKLLDRDDYTASIHSSDGGSDSGTEISSVVPDELPTGVAKRTKQRGLTSTLAQDHAQKLDENYCGLCGTIHEPRACHMVQTPDNLAEYRAMLMEVTNEETEPIEIRVSGLVRGQSMCLLVAQRAAIQAIDETLLKMGKLDMIKGQPAYLADKSQKRKKPHEPDQGENAIQHVKKARKPRKPRKFHGITTTQMDLSQPWKVLTPTYEAPVNSLTWKIPTVPALPPAVDITSRASSSNGPGPSFSTNPPRSVKKAKISSFSTFAITGDSQCLLCGGSKHTFRDCPIPKGGIEKWVIHSIRFCPQFINGPINAFQDRRALPEVVKSPGKR